jgi:hypothetical protein
MFVIPFIPRRTIVKQSALERSVAHATGETVTRIRQMGFSLVRMPDRCLAAEELRRSATPQRRSEAAASEPHARRCW